MNKTNMQRIKELIAECNEAAEMVGIISGIEAAAVIYCSEHCPEEVYNGSAGATTTISGMKRYIESEA